MSVENRGIGPTHHGQAPARADTAREAGDSGPVQVRGDYKGREVAVRADPHSAVADSAEELTFSLADTVERKLFDRKVRKKDAGGASASEEALADTMSRKLKGMDPEKMKKMLADARENRPASPSELKDMAKREFPDSSSRHLALEFLRESVAESGDDPELLAIIDSALIMLEDEEGPAIRAGYNIDAAALTRLDSPDGHREAYRENVLSFRNASGVFVGLLRRYGEDGVQAMLDYLSDSLAVDMEALSPSMDRDRLAMVNDGLATARSLINTLDDARELIKSTGCGRGPKPAEPGKLASTLMDVKDGKIGSVVELKMRLPLAGKQNPTRDVELLTGFIGMARRVPDRLFRDGAARQTALDVIQSALDEAVELEEKVLDGLE